MPLTVRGGDGDGHVDVGPIFWPLAPGGGAWVGVPASTYPDVSVLESRRCTATKKQTGSYVWYGAKLSPPTDSGFTGLRWRWDAAIRLQLTDFFHDQWISPNSIDYGRCFFFKLTKEFILQQQLKIQSIRFKLAKFSKSTGVKRRLTCALVGFSDDFRRVCKRRKSRKQGPGIF